MENIAKRLEAFRDSTGLNKRAFAEKINLDSGLYGRYEAGSNRPSFETLEKIAGTFPKLSLNWLLTGRGEMVLGKPAAEAPAPLTSGAATVEYASELASNSVLRELIDTQKETISDLRSTVEFLKAELGKFGGSLEAAWFGNHPAAPQVGVLELSR